MVKETGFRRESNCLICRIKNKDIFKMKLITKFHALIEKAFLVKPWFWWIHFIFDIFCKMWMVLSIHFRSAYWSGFVFCIAIFAAKVVNQFYWLNQLIMFNYVTYYIFFFISSCKFFFYVLFMTYVFLVKYFNALVLLKFPPLPTFSFICVIFVVECP